MTDKQFEDISATELLEEDMVTLEDIVMDHCDVLDNLDTAIEEHEEELGVVDARLTELEHLADTTIKELEVRVVHLENVLIKLENIMSKSFVASRCW